VIELNLIKLLESLDVFNKYEHILEKYLISEESKVLFKDIKKYYDETPDDITSIDWDKFGLWFRMQHPMFGSAKHETYTLLIHKLHDMAPCNGADPYVRNLRQQYYSHQVANLGLEGTEGSATALDQVADLLTEYQESAAHVHTDYVVTNDINALVEYASPKGGLKWRMSELNLSYGPLKKGDLVLLGALPELGKTTFLASELTYMAPQLPTGSRVVYFTNEEAGMKVKLRIIQAALGVPKEDIDRNPVGAIARYTDLMGDVERIMVHDKSNLSVRDIENFLRKHDIGLIVVDQMRKVLGTGIDANNDVAVLAALYNKARQWAKDYAPVITVHQASALAEGMLFPLGTMLHGAKIDVQGELDLQIMMGRSNHPDYHENLRGLNVVKSKSTSAKSEHRHRKWEVMIQPDIARFVGMV